MFFFSTGGHLLLEQKPLPLVELTLDLTFDFFPFLNSPKEKKKEYSTQGIHQHQRARQRADQQHEMPRTDERQKRRVQDPHAIRIGHASIRRERAARLLHQTRSERPGEFPAGVEVAALQRCARYSHS